MPDSPFTGAAGLRPAYEAVDWDASPLGPVTSWSPTLRAVLDMAWRTRFPVTLFWGPQKVLLYNEAYIPLIADKHPGALGSTTEAVFPEVWDTIGPMIDAVMAGGETVWVQNAHLPLQRRAGQLEDAWFTFSYSAVHGPDGAVEGAIDIATETTEQVLGQRRLTVLAEVASVLAGAEDEQHVADAVLHRVVGDLGANSAAFHLLPGGDAALTARRETNAADIGPVEAPSPLDGDQPVLTELALPGTTVDALLRGSAVQALAQRHAVSTADRSTTSEDSEASDAGDQTSPTEDLAAVALPLFVDGRAVGALTAAWTSWQQLSDAELAPLRALTAQATDALQRVRARRDEQATAARIAAITESMAVGYLSMDADWRITHVNAEAIHALGLPREELVGGLIWELFPATVGTDFEAGYRRAAQIGEQVVFDAYYPQPLNAWYEVRATPEAGGVALYFIDITDRRSAEHTRRAAAERVRNLAEVALALSAIEDVPALVTVMAEQGSAALGCDGGAVAVIDPDDPGRLLSYITAGHAPEIRAQYAVVGRDDPVPVAEVVRTGEAVLLGNHEAALAYSTVMAQATRASGAAAFASLPLRAGAEVVGVLTTTWNTPQTFEAAQVELLEAFAAQCAQALQRLHARDAERRSTQRQSALVTTARALADAEDEGDVLAVIAAQGAVLLPGSVWGLGLRSADGTAVRVMGTEDIDARVRARVQQLPADFALPVVHSAATGTAHYLPDRDQTTERFGAAGELYTAAGLQASASVPLRARGELLGCLSAAVGQVHLWSGEERDLLEAFAGLTAQALARIAAHEAEQAALAAAAGTAQTLQRAMLTAPPEPDHLQIVVRYTAAAEAAEVGGDWYDAFLTAEGQTSLVIGDVTGHDMRAAAVMGQLRNLVRGIGYTLGEPPAGVLAAVDRAAAGLGINTVATAVLAQVEQDQAHRAAGTRLLRWSNAGHLPPLLIEGDGTVSYLEHDSDLVLGWDPAVQRHDHEVVLSPGATVLLYTDGLIERRGVSLERGLAWLAETAAELVGASDLTLEGLCDALLELVGGHLDDDVALLALRAHPEDGPRPVEAGPARVPSGLGAARAAAPQDGPL